MLGEENILITSKCLFQISCFILY